jgi:hypothetical protein
MQTEINNGNNGNGNGNGKTNARVLRFEFSGPIIERLNDFVIVHNYDDRKTYKEAWTAWLAHDEIAALIRTEVARLSALGYTGDVVDKLFKSGRYYFRDKAKTEKDNNKDNKDNRNRKYVLLNRQLLDAMDDHIERGLRQNGHVYTPASGFADFCKTDNDAYHREVTRLSELMPAVHEKLKKTYKNRYFMMTRI